jgi:uncharacterized protein YjbI with pentapeptide repeats
VDATEVDTAGAVFDACGFVNKAFNGSRHRESAFVNCRFDGVELTGPEFRDVRFLAARGAPSRRCEPAAI